MPPRLIDRGRQPRRRLGRHALLRLNDASQLVGNSDKLGRVARRHSYAHPIHIFRVPINNVRGKSPATREPWMARGEAKRRRIPWIDTACLRGGYAVSRCGIRRVSRNDPAYRLKRRIKGQSGTGSFQHVFNTLRRVIDRRKMPVMWKHRSCRLGAALSPPRLGLCLATFLLLALLSFTCAIPLWTIHSSAGPMARHDACGFGTLRPL